MGQIDKRLPLLLPQRYLPSQMNSMRSWFLLLPAIFSLASHAQSILTPSEKAVERKWIQTGHYEMTWYTLRDTSRMEMGRVSTQLLTDKKTLTVVTTVAMKNSTAPWVDTSIARLATLQPVRHASYNRQRDMVL
jgi:hypothetical protein